MTLFELITVSVTLLAVYLTTRQIIWCWPIALVSVILYAIVFYQARLYADMGLQGVYFGLSLYGWWAWLHGDEHHGELEVSMVSWRMRLTLLLIGASSGVLLGAALHRLTDASLPFLDSTLSSFSIIAQWMQTRKRLETWIVWIAADLCYVGMFIYKALYLTAALYAVFLYLAGFGFLEWKRSMALTPDRLSTGPPR